MFGLAWLPRWLQGGFIKWLPKLVWSIVTMFGLQYLGLVVALGVSHINK